VSRDVHGERPTVQIPLEKVGLTGIKMPLSFTKFEGKDVVIVPSFDVYIDLPAERRGIDASRSYEVIAEVFNAFAKKVLKIEDICAAIAEELLKRHEYASRAEVKARAEAIFERRTPQTGMLTYEPYEVMAGATSKLLNSKIETRKMVGVKVIGITACPCVREALQEASVKEASESLNYVEDQARTLINRLPIATHMQRSEGEAMIEVPEGFNVDVTDLIRIVEKALSASTFELLKRKDEVALVLTAMSNPRFVEDSIRLMAKGVVDHFKHFPDDVKVRLSIRSRESVHKHDLVAVRNTSLGQLRREVLG